MAWKGKKLSTTIASDSTLTTVDTVKIEQGASMLWLEVDSTVGPALNAFEVALRVHSDSAFHIIADATSDFTTAIPEPIEGCTHDMTVLPGLTEGMIQISTRGLYSIRFRANTATATSDVTLDTKWQQR